MFPTKHKLISTSPRRATPARGRQAGRLSGRGAAPCVRYRRGRKKENGFHSEVGRLLAARPRFRGGASPEGGRRRGPQRRSKASLQAKRIDLRTLHYGESKEPDKMAYSGMALTCISDAACARHANLLNITCRGAARRGVQAADSASAQASAHSTQQQQEQRGPPGP